ncbi:hypothetical protein [Streptomyces sp. NPDC000134]|jgi:hypothetical protein|uniref:hypothetical protein n=1 Tax=Streptomyces sp. NPDC000134 TaxID=3364536 RepID=UPI00369B7971
MIAIAVAVMQVVVILIHRRRHDATGPRVTPWAYMAACLGACVVGWLIIGRPTIEWGDLFLALVFGVLIGSETARSVEDLSGRAWAAWATAAVCGAASATWLLQNPLPFT